MGRETERKIGFLLADLNGGGGERVIVHLANALAQKGIPTDLILLKNKGAFVKEVAREVRIIDFDKERILGGLWPLVLYLHVQKPQAVVATSIHMQVLLLLARMFCLSSTKVILRIGIPLSVRFTTLVTFQDKLVARLARLLFPNAEALLPNSEGVANDMVRELGISRDKMEVIYNPINLALIQKKMEVAPPHRWFEEDVPVIVAAGRLRKQKDFSTLIRALPKIGSNVRLLILGRGSEIDALRDVASTCEVSSRVDFVGFVSNPYSYMGHADIFVLPSIFEGFPNVLLEAMACGVPVISTDCPFGPRELLAPNTSDKNLRDVEYAEYGILVPTKNVDILARTVSYLLRDSNMRNRYQSASKSRSKDFEIKKIITQYEQVLYR